MNKLHRPIWWEVQLVDGYFLPRGKLHDVLVLRKNRLACLVEYESSFWNCVYTAPSYWTRRDVWDAEEMGGVRGLCCFVESVL